MIDLQLDEMYAAGALNTYIDELRQWIREKEAAIEKHRGKTYLLPVVEHLEKHIEFVKSLLVKAEEFQARKEAAPR